MNWKEYNDDKMVTLSGKQYKALKTALEECKELVYQAGNTKEKRAELQKTARKAIVKAEELEA